MRMKLGSIMETRSTEKELMKEDLTRVKKETEQKSTLNEKYNYLAKEPEHFEVQFVGRVRHHLQNMRMYYYIRALDNGVLDS